MTTPAIPPIDHTVSPPKTWPIPLVMFETTSIVSTQYTLLAIMACVLLAVGLYTLNFFHKKKVLEEGELLERPSFIHKVLTLALASRCRLDIFLASEARVGQPIMGSIEELTAKTLKITLSSGKVPPKFFTTPILLYFQINTGNETFFYSFTGTVLAHATTASGLCITMAVPKLLSNTQKREFVRVAPGPGMVEALVVWKCDTTPDITTLPTLGQNFGSPHFTYRPPKAAQVALIDISGGGVLLRLAGERIMPLNMRFAMGEAYSMLVLLHDIETDRIITLWLAGICRRVRLTKDTTNAEVGIQFTHWAQVEKPTQPICWQKVERDGEVPLILTWSLRVQTFLTRHASM